MLKRGPKGTHHTRVLGDHAAWQACRFGQILVDYVQMQVVHVVVSYRVRSTDVVGELDDRLVRVGIASLSKEANGRLVLLDKQRNLLVDDDRQAGRGEPVSLDDGLL